MNDLGLGLGSLEHDPLIPSEGSRRHVLPEERQGAALTPWVSFGIDLAFPQVYKRCWNAFKELKFSTEKCCEGKSICWILDSAHQRKRQLGTVTGWGGDVC